jgi:hypothetical protein
MSVQNRPQPFHSQDDVAFHSQAIPLQNNSPSLDQDIENGNCWRQLCDVISTIFSSIVDCLRNLGICIPSETPIDEQDFNISETYERPASGLSIEDHFFHRVVQNRKRELLIHNIFSNKKQPVPNMREPLEMRAFSSLYSRGISDFSNEEHYFWDVLENTLPRESQQRVTDTYRESASPYGTELHEAIGQSHLHGTYSVFATITPSILKKELTNSLSTLVKVLANLPENSLPPIQEKYRQFNSLMPLLQQGMSLETLSILRDFQTLCKSTAQDWEQEALNPEKIVLDFQRLFEELKDNLENRRPLNANEFNRQINSHFAHLVEQIRQDPGLKSISWVHGCSSGVIPMIKRSGFVFKCTGDLNKEGAISFSGENGKGAAKNGVNQKGLSGVTLPFAAGSISYASGFNDAESISIGNAKAVINSSAQHLIEKSIPGIHSDIDNIFYNDDDWMSIFLNEHTCFLMARTLRQLKLADTTTYESILQPVLDQWFNSIDGWLDHKLKKDRTGWFTTVATQYQNFKTLVQKPLPYEGNFTEQEIEFIEGKFPIVVATATEKQLTAVPASSIRGEHLIEHPLMLGEQLQYVFTDEVHVESLRQYFLENGLDNIKVYGMDMLYFVRDLSVYKMLKENKPTIFNS